MYSAWNLSQNLPIVRQVGGNNKSWKAANQVCYRLEMFCLVISLRTQDTQGSTFYSKKQTKPLKIAYNTTYMYMSILLAQ